MGPIQEMLFEGGRWAAIYAGLGEGLYYKSVQPKMFALIGRAGNDRLTHILVRAVVSVCQKAPLPVVLYQCLRRRPGFGISLKRLMRRMLSFSFTAMQARPGRRHWYSTTGRGAFWHTLTTALTKMWVSLSLPARPMSANIFGCTLL